MHKLSATYWLLIIVSALGIGYLFVKYIGKTERSSSYKATLVNFAPEALTALTISQGNQVTQLTKRHDTWHVSLPSQKEVPADNEKVQEVIELLLKITPDRIYAKSDDVWGKLGLDTTGVRVEAIADQKVLDIVLGRTEFPENERGSYYTYVRLYDEHTSYVATDVLVYGFRTDPHAYRPTTLFKFQPDSVTHIRFVNNETNDSLRLQKKDSSWFAAPSHTPVTSTPVQDYLRNVSSLSSTANFKDTFTPIGAPLRSVHIITATDTQAVHFYRNNADWLLQSSINQESFLQDSSATEQLWKSSTFFLDFNP